MLAHVIDSVPGSKEGIPDDEQGPSRWGNIDAHEDGEAHTRSLHYIIICFQGKVIAGEAELDGRQLGDTVAVNDVHASE